MSFNFNLASLTESARDRFARLETQGSSLRDRLRSPSPRSLSAAAFTSPSTRPSHTVGLSAVSEVGPSGESLSSLRLSGGGASALSVFEMTSDLQRALCCGIVSNGLKFCTLGGGQCSYTSHSKKVPTNVGCLYISTGRNSAFANHCMPVALLTRTQVDDVIQEKHTKEEWAQLFNLWKSQTDQGGVSTQVNDSNTNTMLMSAIKPPKRARPDLMLSPFAQGKDYDASSSMSASEDDFDLLILPSEDSSDKTPEEKINLLLSQWDALVGSVTKVSDVVRRLRKSHETDVETLDDKINAVDAMIGRCEKDSLKDDCISVWDGIVYLHNTVESLTASFKTLERTIVTLGADVHGKFKANETSLTKVINDMSTGFQDLANFTKALNDEQALIGQHLAAMSGSSSSGSSSRMEHELQSLAAKVSSLESGLNPSLNSGNQAYSSSALEEIASLKIQLRLLESRIPVHGVLKLGGSVFQSRADVALFVETKMPSNAFSMFHDIITLMERLSGNYVERKDVISEWYQATKVGLDEREARHVASFKITYPTVFGYVKEGAASSKYHLPAVKTFKDWNSFDSESGVKSFILNGMEDLKLQLNQDISSFFEFDQFYDAKVLAHDMHAKSQIFIAEMCNWMDVFYQELLTTSEATDEEAWELVSACIKKIFEELRRVRASAANATSEVNATNKCATYLWALIQSHRIMKDFLDMRFRNHPSIAPVIILHVFKTRVTRVSHTNHIKRLEGRIAKLESAPAFKNPRSPPKDSEGEKKGGKN